jgi:serine protease Do
MTQNPKNASPGRRATLMGSVAGIGLAILLAGSGAFQSIHSPSWSGSALAAETANPAPGFADIVARVKPAVISVRVRFDAKESARLEGNEGPVGSRRPFDRFFHPFGSEGMRPEVHRVAAEGSGFFISADGYAVTNNHVVDHAASVQVVTDGGTILKAKVIGTDPKTDLALIKVDGNDFPFVKFANHDPRVGDWVVAVGNPFGLGGTVTAGVVSAKGRDIGSGPYDDFIQIDAPVNKGNSGGPSFDINGNVIGVNTAIVSPSGGSVGIGFDIPAETVKSVVAQLKDHGHVTRGWMGAQIQSVTADIAESLGLKRAGGAIVDQPQQDSPAAAAGIKAGDVITTVDGTAVKDANALVRKISAMAPGTSVHLGVLQNGSEKSVTLTLGALPDQHQANANGSQGNSEQGASEQGAPHLGLALAPARALGAGEQGVVVTAVDPNGPAADRGLRSGDIILDVAGKAVSNPADVGRELTSLEKAGKHAVLMRVKSGSAIGFVALHLGTG